MIRETVSPKNSSALTSDQWHVVHACLSTEPSAKPRFVRSIVSEHADRHEAVAAARAIVSSLAPKMATLSWDVRDQVFVRRPRFNSLKIASRVTKRRK